MRRLAHREATSRVRAVGAALVLVAAGGLAWGFALNVLDARVTHREGTPGTATVRTVDHVRGSADTAKVDVDLDGTAVRGEVVLAATDLEPEPGDRIEVRHRWVDGELIVVAEGEVFWWRAVQELLVAGLTVTPLTALGLWLAGVRRGPSPAWPS